MVGKQAPLLRSRVSKSVGTFKGKLDTSIYHFAQHMSIGIICGVSFFVPMCVDFGRHVFDADCSWAIMGALRTSFTRVVGAVTLRGGGWLQAMAQVPRGSITAQASSFQAQNFTKNWSLCRDGFPKPNVGCVTQPSPFSWGEVIKIEHEGGLCI